MVAKLTPSEASVRKQQVTLTARDTFLRYGYARTTIQDIAQGVGISRPALYLIFSSKDEVFSAVIRHLSRESLAEMREALPKFRTLKQKLHFCCEKWGTHGYDLMQVHPDAKDLFDLAFVPVQRMYGDFEEFLTEILSEAMSGTKIKFSPVDLARVIVFAMRGFKETAKNGADMRQLISLQVEVVIAALKI